MQYRTFLRVLAVLTAVLCAVWLFLSASTGRFSSDTEDGPEARANTQCTTEERVFDYADVLTDSEEDTLRSLIADYESRTACDIVLVTLNESLQDYQPAGSGFVPMATPENWITAYADDFWDTHYFGYNTGVEGDGVILVDDWYREPYDGKMHTWLSTSGRAYAALGNEEIDDILDDVYDYIETDTLKAYSSYVKSFSTVMMDEYGGNRGLVFLVNPLALLLPLIAALALLFHYLRARRGKVTVKEDTYIQGGARGMSVQINTQTDRFLHKHVTRERIVRSEESSGGGGGFGGGHSSSGGFSHGGGGHSR